MVDKNGEQRIAELEALRAPPRSDIERRRARDRIIAAADPLLARRRRVSSSMEILAVWARPGLIAAGIALAVLIGALRLGRGGDGAADQQLGLDQVLRGTGTSGSVPALLLAVSEPDADAVMEAALLGWTSNGGDER